MAIDTITPAATSLVEPGDSFSFTVDNTYTAMTIEVETSGGWEYAYDGTLGGAQGGYTVSVTVSGGRHIFVVTRDAGWNLSPTSIRVIEDESGALATTTTNYVLATAASYPQTSTPYYINPSLTSTKFTDLIDTPAAYTGAGLQTVRVNAAGTALEFAGVGGAVTLGAAATTFAITDTFMTITGDAGANTLATITGAGAGQILTLLFVDALVTVTDDNTHAADSIDLSAAFTSADDTTLQLIYNGTSWYEVSRSVN